MAREELLKATFDQIAKDDSSEVYVLNTASGKKAGIVHMTVTPGNEQPISVTVPNTWAPFDITTQIAKVHLMQSSHFRRAINTGLLSLLNTQSAIKFLAENPDAALENADAMQRTNGIVGAMNELNYDDDDDEKEDTRNAYQKAKDKLRQNNSSHVDLVEENNDPENNVTMKLREAVARTDITEQELYSIVRGITHENKGLNRVDADFILKNVHHDKVLAFVNNLGK